VVSDHRHAITGYRGSSLAGLLGREEASPTPPAVAAGKGAGRTIAQTVEPAAHDEASVSQIHPKAAAKPPRPAATQTATSREKAAGSSMTPPSWKDFAPSPSAPNRPNGRSACGQSKPTATNCLGSGPRRMPPLTSPGACSTRWDRCAGAPSQEFKPSCGYARQTPRHSTDSSRNGPRR
jgi:hypothetical protein